MFYFSQRAAQALARDSSRSAEPTVAEYKQMLKETLVNVGECSENTKKINGVISQLYTVSQLISCIDFVLKYFSGK